MYLYSVPTTHIRDYYVTTDLDQFYKNATLAVKAEVTSYMENHQGGFKIKTTLFDRNKKPVKTIYSEKFEFRNDKK
ncbi:MAG: hypothetical protein HC906_13780, partial [Bacteroidales bacterium]|nr:hypothetical protein [Bacteroidales bacterium]